MKANPQRTAEEAHTALEIFDMAAEILNRIRGDGRTQRTRDALIRRLLDARGYQLSVLDRARSECHSQVTEEKTNG